MVKIPKILGKKTPGFKPITQLCEPAYIKIAKG